MDLLKPLVAFESSFDAQSAIVSAQNHDEVAKELLFRYNISAQGHGCVVGLAQNGA